jgi:hypothetical protein
LADVYVILDPVVDAPGVPPLPAAVAVAKDVSIVSG